MTFSGVICRVAVLNIFLLGQLHANIICENGKQKLSIIGDSKTGYQRAIFENNNTSEELKLRTLNHAPMWSDFLVDIIVGDGDVAGVIMVRTMADPYIYGSTNVGTPKAKLVYKRTTWNFACYNAPSE